MRPGAEILLMEADALPVVLAPLADAEYDRPTLCDGWSVRDVLAHCASALSTLVAGEKLEFTPEANQRGVDARSDVPVANVVTELIGLYREAAVKIDSAGGALDALGLGEWVHGGDVREAIGVPDAYASAGIDLAIPLIIERFKQRDAPCVEVSLTDTGEDLLTGDGEPVASLVADRATFVRLVAGRRPDRTRYTFAGLDEDSVLLFT